MKRVKLKQKKEFKNIEKNYLKKENFILKKA